MTYLTLYGPRHNTAYNMLLHAEAYCKRYYGGGRKGLDMSFKVVIIDDNINTVKSLQVSINWNEMGLEVVGSADNGIKGIELIRKKEPDIIITDIHM